MSTSLVPVVIYRMDDQCTKLESTSVALPKEKTLERAIGTILDQANTPDFTISDYQVAKANGIATITLRIAPGAKRSFASMSTCEQMAFFGAMRETLVQRKEWSIREVKFTDGKKEIRF